MGEERHYCMVGPAETSFAERYFGDWAAALNEDQPLPVPPADEVRNLTRVRAFADAGTFDATHIAASQVVSAANFAGELDKYTSSEGSAKENLRLLYRLYDETRGLIKKHRDVVPLIVRAQTEPVYGLDYKVLSYLMLGESPTRLGEPILLPAQDADDRSLRVLLGAIRVIGEHYMDEALGLRWYGDDDSPEAARSKTWEAKAGALGDSVGGALGRAAAVGAASLVSPLLKLPDELSLCLSYAAGVAARKGAEAQMHRYLGEHPEFGW